MHGAVGGGGQACAWPRAAVEEAERACGAGDGGAMGCGAPGRAWQRRRSRGWRRGSPTWATTIAVTVGGGTNGILPLPPQRHSIIPMYMDEIMKCKIDDWDIMHISHRKIGVKPIRGQANLIDRSSCWM
uniref:Uncharacterized protein n=1 Tax=Oryza meridionalis TaxID=40149 RepID=A0A0E0EKD7_9ORYZ